MNKILFFLCLLWSSFLFSQEKIILKGRVTSDSLNLPDINIINLNQETGTISTIIGKFKIRVKKNDTLLFSSVQHENKKIIITSEILENEFLDVELEENINELAEVQISNINLSGNLQQDLTQVEIFDQAEIGFPLSSAKPRTYIERKLDLAYGGPVITLINTLNGRIKMLKKARSNEVLDDLIDKAVKAVPEEFFIEKLKIPKYEIENFVHFCSNSSNFKILVSEERKLELIELFKRKAAEFKVLKDME